ncbi:MAG: hypothetical protein WBD26_04375, partial [Candidatus Acidiferrales bacterium]
AEQPSDAGSASHFASGGGEHGSQLSITTANRSVGGETRSEIFSHNDTRHRTTTAMSQRRFSEMTR